MSGGDRGAVGGADALDGAGAGNGSAGGYETPLTAAFPLPGPVDLRLTLSPLRHGPGDATMRLGPDGVWMARRGPAGPATLHLRIDAASAVLHARAWGPGAEEAVGAAPGLAGLLDEPLALVPRHELVHELQRRFPGLRLPRTGRLLPALIAAVTEQKVTAGEAQRAYAGLIRRVGYPAPGPGAEMGLRLAPAGAALAALPYFEMHPMGLERRRSELIRRLGGAETRIESLQALTAAEASERLLTMPGIGPWTAAETIRAAFGDPDAVSLGDAHIPDMVSWALAGEPRSDDARMLELLEPYRGQRGRVVRLLEAAGIRPPRYGPRFTPGRIERL